MNRSSDRGRAAARPYRQRSWAILHPLDNPDPYPGGTGHWPVLSGNLPDSELPNLIAQAMADAQQRVPTVGDRGRFYIAR